MPPPSGVSEAGVSAAMRSAFSPLLVSLLNSALRLAIWLQAALRAKPELPHQLLFLLSHSLIFRVHNFILPVHLCSNLCTLPGSWIFLLEVSLP